jgi:hypothetical protein
MTKYLIIERSVDDPSVHPPGSLELTACEIAKQMMFFHQSADRLMAIDSEGPVATFAHLNASALCSITVDKDSQSVWNNEVPDIDESLRNFRVSKSRAEDELDAALSEMIDKFSESSVFNDIDPENDIGVYSALESLGYDDVDYKFRRAVQDHFQYQEMQGMFK